MEVRVIRVNGSSVYCSAVDDVAGIRIAVDGKISSTKVELTIGKRRLDSSAPLPDDGTMGSSPRHPYRATPSRESALLISYVLQNNRLDIRYVYSNNCVDDNNPSLHFVYMQGKHM